MIKLLYKGKNRAINKAVKNANDILQNSTFYDRVASLPQMSNTNLTSQKIAAILRQNNQEIVVESYWNPFSKPVRESKPSVLRVNTCNLSCITAFAVNTLINETLFSVSLNCDALNFEETDSDEMEYPNVFPLRIGEVAEILTRKITLTQLRA